MPEIEKKIEQNLKTKERQESLSQSPEQRENLNLLEKISESEEIQIPKEKKDISDNNGTMSGQQPLGNTPVSDRLKEAIDNILEEGLEDIYLNLPKETQKEFKVKGEEATNKINNLLKETKVKAKKIIQVIMEWLKLVPGINKFFIKQTAKIKTDKILAAKDKGDLEI